MLDLLGYEIERRGNVLILPMGSVGVEEACSGIRSLTACLFAGSFLAAVFLDRFWKKFVLVGAAMVLAVITIYSVVFSLLYGHIIMVQERLMNIGICLSSETSVAFMM